MAQTPVSVKLALPQKPGFLGRSNIVQVLQTQPGSSGQTIIQQRSPALKSFTTIRPFVSNVAGAPFNTNTAVQYIRKPAELSVLSSGGTFLSAPVPQPFSTFGSPMIGLNPNLMPTMTGPGNLTSGPVGLGGTGGVLSSMANSRKPCNCTKSHCLKLYCECFAQGQLCQNCNCNNCMNNLSYEEERGRAIKMTLERNPTAFHPKIGRGEGERKHTKGCNCKRSGCLKNYCECYEAKISCSDLCRCQGCRNTEDSVERRSLLRLAAMGALRSRQPASFKKHLIKPPPETLPHVFFTWEVIEAVASCLLAQADDAERRDLPPAAQERVILEEFGRVLERVIDSASKAQVLSSSVLHTSNSMDENDQPLLHGSGSATGMVKVGVGGVGTVAAAAAAADVLLRDDDEDDDEIMGGMGVEDDDDQGDIDDEMFDDSHHGHHHSGHGRSQMGRRVLSQQRSSHHVSGLDDGILSDEDPVDRARRHGNISPMSHRFQELGSRRTQSIESRYMSHHPRRSATSGGRSHRHHDPDSII